LPVKSNFKGTYKALTGLSPPLGLLYIAKVLEQDDNKVNLLDFSAEKIVMDKLMSRLLSTDAVCMTVMSDSVQKADEMIMQIKEKDNDLPIIIGGPHCALFPKRALKETHADISVQGDGEGIMLDIKKALNNKKSFSEIPGIYYRSKNTIKRGPLYQPIENLDSVPFPARHLSKKYLYGKAYNQHIKKGEFTSIITSRGCPFKCNFCSRGAVSLNRHRTRSTENILDEFREIYSMGYKYVGIMDDSFLSNKKQANAIFDTIINENMEMKFYITASRADSADRDLFNKMKRAGVISIQFGLESANQDVLDYYNKSTTVEKIRKAVILSHEAGFFTLGSFILGAPFETKQHFDNTIKFANSLPLESAIFLPLRYRAGSDMWLKAVKEGKIALNEYEVHADSKRDLGLFTEQELLNYCEKGQMLFSFNPKYIFNLFRSSIEKNDFSLLHMYISIYLSFLKEHSNPFTFINKKNA